LLLVVIPFSLYPQPVQDDWWQALYEEGTALLQQGQFVQAETKFKAIIARNDQIGQAYYGLGMVYAQTEPGSKRAIDAFVKATKLKRDYAPAYFQLALIYRGRGDNRDKVLENLHKATQLDPDFTAGWFELAEMTIDPEQPVKSIIALSEEIETNINFVDPCSRYIMDSLHVRFADIPETILELFRAKLLFTLDKVGLAVPRFWSAVHAIADSMDAHAVLDDVCYIMYNEEYDTLSRLPIDSLGAFYQRFWSRRDPDLATEDNERIGEHYRRLIHAYRQYPRDKEAARSVMKTHRRYHPVRRFYAVQSNMMGNELLTRIGFPDAIPADRPFDDAALIYIRHGSPDVTATGVAVSVDYSDVPPSLQKFFREHFQESMANYDQARERYLGMDLQPQNLSWKYRATVSRPELIFHFFKYGGESGWVIEAIPSSLYGRETWGPQYYSLKQSLAAAEFAEMGREIFDEVYAGQAGAEVIDFESIYSEHTMKIPALAMEMEAESVDFLETGFATETSDLDFEAEPLDFRYNILAFKDNDGGNRVEVYYAVQGDRTRLIGEGTDTKLVLEQSFVFQNKDSDEVIRISRTNETHVGLSQEAWNSKGILAVESIAMTPGNYRYEIQFSDDAAGRLGIYKGQYTNTDYHLPDLTISDILLIGSIRPATGREDFSKGEIAFTPKLFANYKRGEKIGIYYEVYNLTFDESGRTDYEIEYELKQPGEKGVIKKVLGIFGGKDEVVASQYRYNGSARDEKIHFTFDLSGRPAGNYEIHIRVKDLNHDETTERMVGINVVN
jgi:GWxTD domain-containing protein